MMPTDLLGAGLPSVRPPSGFFTRGREWGAA
jgi:hypothetical protein